MHSYMTCGTKDFVRLFTALTVSDHHTHLYSLHPVLNPLVREAPDVSVMLSD